MFINGLVFGRIALSLSRPTSTQQVYFSTLLPFEMELTVSGVCVCVCGGGGGGGGEGEGGVCVCVCVALTIFLTDFKHGWRGLLDQGSVGGRHSLPPPPKKKKKKFIKKII